MPGLENPRARLLELIVAFRQTQCVRVAVELGVADQLASGPAASAELAVACRAEEPFLRRLLRALTGLGLLDQDHDGRYRLTTVGEQMRSDRLGPAALFFGRDPVWSAWGALDHAIRTGDHPFDHLYGMRLWDYYAANPDDAARFDAAMASITGRLAEAVVSSYDFSGFTRVVDVGGGDGTTAGRDPSVSRRPPAGCCSRPRGGGQGASRHLTRPACWTEPSWSAETSTPPFRRVRTAVY